MHRQPKAKAKTRTKTKTRNTITASTFPNSAPRLTRCEITHSTLDNLSHEDSIRRSSLISVLISKTLPAPPIPTPVSDPGSRSGSDASASTSSEDIPRTRNLNNRLTLRRCKVTSSSLNLSFDSPSNLSRSTITTSTLTKIPNARSLISTSSTLHDTSTLRRSRVTNSTVTEHTALSRSVVSDSVISESAIYRSKIDKSRVSGSQVKKSKLQDCEIVDCVVINCEFRGMVLRNGVWKNGKLVGPFSSEGGDQGAGSAGGEVLITKREKKEKEGPEWWMEGLASDSEGTDLDSESEDEGEEEDLPPPYTP
ncbi:hypothetical protein BJX70DRAFT_372043 [Aspergillus crustosus]